ncbi:sororin [Sphaeramia orbicularis]|uniref:sororin n=1 Tax=Sphaeramia orbicularis TaxID=375764 RepID=UPI00117FDA27|nr:sororin [Sphaeramia orbicularis]
MHEGTPNTAMAESNNINGPQRRRSARLSPRQADLTTDNKMARPGFAVKRSITVKKIAPRKTTAPSEHNKENTPRRSGSESVQQKKPKVSTPSPVPENRGSSSSKKKQKAAVPSPILPSTPPPASQPQQPDVDPADAVWSQKVRRSYSRLSDKSFNSPESRETLFGFEKLNTPVVMRRGGGGVRGETETGLEVSGFLSGLSSFTSLLEADDCASAFPEPDPNIPGVAVVKEKRRRKKVQQIDNAELDQLAAKMNAEFEEAEGFELIVE